MGGGGVILRGEKNSGWEDEKRSTPIPCWQKSGNLDDSIIIQSHLGHFSSATALSQREGTLLLPKKLKHLRKISQKKQDKVMK